MEPGSTSLRRSEHVSRLVPLPQREVVRRLRKLGFEGPFPGQKHPHMMKGERRITIPNPHGGDISSGLIAEILRQACVTRDEWFSVA